MNQNYQVVVSIEENGTTTMQTLTITSNKPPTQETIDRAYEHQNKTVTLVSITPQ